MYHMLLRLSHMEGLDGAGNAMWVLLEVLQAVPKPDGALARCLLRPVQQEGQQFMLGQVSHRLWAKIMHAGTGLSLNPNSRCL